MNISMDINGSLINYQRGQIVQQTRMVLQAMPTLWKDNDCPQTAWDIHHAQQEELRRLINNLTQEHGNWDVDLRVLKLIIALTEGYVPDVK